ncbi:Uncharacterised protein [Legionella beliardensis]|uniref:Uncharacterized protein n=1 Tax=Legionella beliardensis TaxID=91822 RepID=A0A378I1L9_9GAMM|nr:Uncharacterised protein [Legionella beliardensis]
MSEEQCLLGNLLNIMPTKSITLTMRKKDYEII